MDSVGAEVGQKMRSAIKAKLMELNCYVDDELPDYIMVMVANKRTKSQMTEDLQLFLTTKTSTFVEWLHIVLKKLKEVTVTNPEVYKKVSKRKGHEDNSNVKGIKKEKHEKKSSRKVTLTNENEKSLTDDLPLNVNNKMSEHRNIIVTTESNDNESNKLVDEDSFDIPLLSEVDGTSSEQQLEDIEKKIKNVKSRLGLLVESDNSNDDCLEIKAEPEEFSSITKKSPRNEVIHEDNNSNKKTVHERITFSPSVALEMLPKKKSVLDRLGKRHSIENNDSFTVLKRQKVDESKSPDVHKSSSRSRERSTERHHRNTKSIKRTGVFDRISNKEGGRSKNAEKIKETILSRLGVQSKISIPSREDELDLKNREVASVIKIKPRVIPPNAPQANKNLLLKAVADAQRSIAQAPKVGKTVKPDALYTKKYTKKEEKTSSLRKLSENQKNRLKKMLLEQVSRPENSRTTSEEEEETTEYIPKPIKKPAQTHLTEYIPSSKNYEESLEEEAIMPENGKSIKQQFIVTLDGIEKIKVKPSIRSRLDSKKSPSPIIFDKKSETNLNSKVKGGGLSINVPDKLPIVHAAPSLKNKERCKYWPNCRHGDKCEFVHPSTNCEKFPQCKFGEKCLYVHPSCKFSNSCTRRDCPYSHSSLPKIVASRIVPSVAPINIAKQTLQTCKFFPNCINLKCSFYHPKACKFGKYCKNQGECNFSHTISKGSLTWRSK